MSELLHRLHLVKGLDPVADAFAGTINSDVVSLRDHGRVAFVAHLGAASPRGAPAGFGNTAGSSKTIAIEADAKDLPSNYGFIRLHAVESVNDPCLGGILIILGGLPGR